MQLSATYRVCRYQTNCMKDMVAALVRLSLCWKRSPRRPAHGCRTRRSPAGLLCEESSRSKCRHGAVRKRRRSTRHGGRAGCPRDALSSFVCLSRRPSAVPSVNAALHSRRQTSSAAAVLTALRRPHYLSGKNVLFLQLKLIDCY